MKKLLLTAMMCLAFSVPTMANDSVTVYSNGNLVADKGVIVDGRTLVPVRGVFEYMGYTVEWDNDTKTAQLTSSDGSTVITLTNGKDTFTINEDTITPDVPQQIIESRFMLPLRAVGEAVNAQVDWNGESKTAYIISQNSDVIESTTETATEETTESNTEVTTKTEVIGNTTITSKMNVPFVTIEGISSDEVPDDAVEIEVE